MISIKDIARRLIYGKRSDSDTYIRHLRSIGIDIGDDVIIYVPSKTIVDESYPWMISIGDHVRITEGVKILTHDYSWSVLKVGKGGPIYGASGKVNIGNNVFIGMNSVILRNVSIGDNVVIGAGSVVSRDCLSGGIYAGNPARRVAELDDFLEKRRAAQLDEARELVIGYFSKYGKMPPEEAFHEYFMLFMNAEEAERRGWCREKMAQGGNYDESLAFLKQNRPMFENYESFAAYCYKYINNV